MNKLYILFTTQFLLKAAHLFFFLKNIPDDLETKSMLYKGDGQIITSVLVLGFVFYFLNRKSKLGYYFLMIIAAVSLLSVFTYGFYFFVAGLLDLPYIIYAVVFFVVNLVIILDLAKKEVKSQYISTTQ